MNVRTDRSEALFRRARRVIPGGVNSPVRAFTAVGGDPRFMARAGGPYVWDVDGRRYIDYVMSWGPLIHGHAFPPIVEAVREAATCGTSFGAPTEAEVVLAEGVTGAVPSVEMVRFVNSGTEATMSALRLARATTGRDLIAKFAGNYHGHADMLLAEAGSGSLTLGVPSSPGVPSGAASATIVVPYNDADELTRIFSRRGREIAAVILEPIAGNMGVVLPRDGFLETVRQLTAEAGSLLIADEVITGFRVARGGAQELFGLQPDITTLGKIVGGGLPVGAYGGRRDLLEHMAPSGPVYQAGTLSGNPLAMAAGIAALKGLERAEFYQDLAATTQRLAGSLTELAQAAGVPVTVNAATGLLTVFFSDRPVRSLADAMESDRARFAQFFHAMLARGVSLPPSQFEAWMPSIAHTPDVVTATLEAAEEAFAEIAAS